MIIQIVTEDSLGRGQMPYVVGTDRVFFKSELSNMKTILADITILGPGLSEAKRSVAIERAHLAGGKVYELLEVTS